MTSVFAPVQSLYPCPWQPAIKQLSVLRLDQLPPSYSGNKYFKLKYTLHQAKADGIKQLVSFGGAYSNHLHALALAGQQHALHTVGIVRGEPTTPLNPTLNDVSNAGMKLRFVSRAQYRLRNDRHYLAKLAAEYPGSLIIPEGGSNITAVRGCMEIVEHIHHAIGRDYDTIVLPCGTAATLAGIVAAAPVDKCVIGISMLKNACDLEGRVAAHLKQLGRKKTCQWRIEHRYHCGGYAKFDKALVQFINDFSNSYGIALEPIYSGKMFYALSQLLAQPIDTQKIISDGAHVVAVHTGGLQGLRGMQPKIDRLLAS